MSELVNICEAKTEVVEKVELERSLSLRHMNMIALGAAIGTGLFLASGTAIIAGGPGGTIAAYSIVGLMVYCLMHSLGEMATYMPVSGSFETYSARFIDPALGFAFGWNYLINWFSATAAALAAATVVMGFWFPNTPEWIWFTGFITILFAINMLSARAFGEAEFVLAGIAVLTCIIFLIVGCAFIFGVGTTPVGFVNWTVGEAPFVNGFGGIFAVLMIAGFSFQGTELVGIAAGESKNPARDVPKAIGGVFWRILLFYIGTMIVIGSLLPYTDENLLKLTSSVSEESISVSPFTLVFKRTGLEAAAHITNGVILMAVLSMAISGLYASSRMLFAMAKEGKAPKIFAKVNSRGIPFQALITATIACYLATSFNFGGASAVFNLLLCLSGVTGFVAWAGIALSHYRFRKAMIAQGKVDRLVFKSKWFPFGPLFTILICIVSVLAQSYTLLNVSGAINWSAFIATNIDIAIVVALWLGYKYVKKTKVITIEDIDLETNSLK